MYNMTTAIDFLKKDRDTTDLMSAWEEGFQNKQWVNFLKKGHEGSKMLSDSSLNLENLIFGYAGQNIKENLVKKYKRLHIGEDDIGINFSPNVKLRHDSDKNWTLSWEKRF